MVVKDIFVICFECLSININYCKYGFVVDILSCLYMIFVVLRSLFM